MVNVFQVNAMGSPRAGWVMKTPAGLQVVAVPGGRGPVRRRYRGRTIRFGAMPGATISMAGPMPGATISMAG